MLVALTLWLWHRQFARGSPLPAPSATKEPPGREPSGSAREDEDADGAARQAGPRACQRGITRATTDHLAARTATSLGEDMELGPEAAEIPQGRKVRAKWRVPMLVAKGGKRTGNLPPGFAPLDEQVEPYVSRGGTSPYSTVRVRASNSRPTCTLTGVGVRDARPRSRAERR